MDLSLFLMKASRFNTDNPEEFAKYLSDKVMHKLENSIRAKKEQADLQQQIDNGDLDDELSPDSLFMSSKKGEAK